MQLITASIPFVLYAVNFGISKLVCHFLKPKKNLPLIYGCLFAFITLLISSALAVFENTAAVQESVSGFMIISAFMVLPWGLIPGYFDFWKAIAEIFYNFNQQYATALSYAAAVVMVSFTWFLNGCLTGVLLAKLNTQKRNDK